MGLFSRFTGKRERVGPYGLWSEDAEQLDTFIERGAVLEAPRDSEFSVTFTKGDRAKDAADALRKMRVRRELAEPSHGVDEWSIIIYGRDTPLVPDFLRDTVDLAREIADQHGGEYEGWVAMFTTEEKAGWDIQPLS